MEDSYFEYLNRMFAETLKRVTKKSEESLDSYFSSELLKSCVSKSYFNNIVSGIQTEISTKIEELKNTDKLTPSNIKLLGDTLLEKRTQYSFTMIYHNSEADIFFCYLILEVYNRLAKLAFLVGGIEPHQAINYYKHFEANYKE